MWRDVGETRERLSVDRHAERQAPCESSLRAARQRMKARTLHVTEQLLEPEAPEVACAARDLDVPLTLVNALLRDAHRVVVDRTKVVRLPRDHSYNQQQHEPIERVVTNLWPRCGQSRPGVTKSKAGATGWRP